MVWPDVGDLIHFQREEDGVLYEATVTSLVVNPQDGGEPVVLCEEESGRQVWCTVASVCRVNGVGV